MAARPSQRRRFSILRFLVLIATIAGVSVGSFFWVKSALTSTASAEETWVAPYADTTLTPLLHFEDPMEQPSQDVVLGFIVADPNDLCQPSWGAYYSIDAAARALDLDRRIVSLHERGGNAVVSFGGAVNQELSVACTDSAKLVSAYQAIIQRYSLKTIDFDIEGAAQGDSAANARRVSAIHQLQTLDKGLKVWLTVPVAPTGMTPEAVTMLDQLLAGGVDLAGVNVMTMDYGGSKDDSMSMWDATHQALTSTWTQVDAAYRKAGQPRSEHDIWQLIGATPMIGQNDIPGETFTLSDASKLMTFAHQVALGRISYWSANRDVQCGANTTDKRVSNTCSGVKQDPLGFGNTFTNGLKINNSSGNAAVSLTKAPPSLTPGTRADGLTHDDPRTSPYPIWRISKVYEAGAKVVWQDRVYQAKWWTDGDQPDAAVKNEWDTPWRYLGPVLPSDRDAVLAVVAPAGVRPHWESERVYVAGDEVEYQGHAFQAKWWTQGDEPQQDPDQPYDHPWIYLGEVPQPTLTPAPAPPFGTVTPGPLIVAPPPDAPPPPTATAPAPTATPTAIVVNPAPLAFLPPSVASPPPPLPPVDTVVPSPTATAPPTKTATSTATPLPPTPSPTPATITVFKQ